MKEKVLEAANAALRNAKPVVLSCVSQKGGQV